jgi:hypothetical protein
MRHGGFFMPFVTMFAMMTLVITAFMVERAASGTALDEKSFIGAQSGITAMMGLKFAEDWLVGELAAGRVPVRRTVMASGEDAGSANRKLADFLDGLDVELQIFAAADYLADSSFRTAFVPNIPLQEVVGEGVLMYYLLRSMVEVKGQDNLTEDEELLCVLISHTGTLSGVTRLFHKSRSERKR